MTSGTGTESHDKGTDIAHTNIHIFPIVSSSSTIDRVELIIGKCMSNVVIISPIKHPPRLLPHLQPLLLGEGAVDDVREGCDGGAVPLMGALEVGEEEQDLREDIPQHVNGNHQAELIAHDPTAGKARAWH